MSVPSLILNGTSGAELVQQRIAAMEALKAAMSAMNETRPHGRDYPFDHDGYEAARNLHIGRYGVLNSLFTELEEEAHAIVRQMERRA